MDHARDGVKLTSNLGVHMLAAIGDKLIGGSQSEEQVRCYLKVELPV
jgi:hypothetical protein